MGYLEKAKNEIRENWFNNHKIKSFTDIEGIQKIVFGSEGSWMYQVEYILSGNNVFVSGDLGIAAFELTELAKIERLVDYDLTYFTRKWSCGNRQKYKFDSRLAKEEIRDYFLEWCDVEETTELKGEDLELYMELISEADQWSLPQHFSNGVYHIYQSTYVDWFDGEVASCMSDCGQRLSHSIIAYWVGLQMINELLSEGKG